MKTAFLGSVELSYIGLKTIVEEGVDVDVVFSLSETASKNVSDYYPLHEYAESNNIDFVKYVKVDEIYEEIKKRSIDILYVIGVSQLIPKRVLSALNGYAIGFHPTPLPKYRGRAPIPWMILLGEKNPMISLFKLDENVDSGDIIIQEPYTIEEDDYVANVYKKVEEALKRALKKCIPAIYEGRVQFKKQDESVSSYLLKRTPEDGEIDWSLMNGKQIYDLVRAVGDPYPGAFTKFKGHTIKCQRARWEKNTQYIGQIGQIAKIDDKDIYVLTRDEQCIVFQEYEVEDGTNVKFSVGGKFGR